MSRNFELLQQADLDHGLFDTHQDKVVSSVSHEYATNGNGKRKENGFAGEQVLKLVHQIFLAGAEKSAKHIVFCGVDDSRGSSWMCARTSQILAAQVPGKICAIDGNLRAPGLRAMFNGWERDTSTTQIAANLLFVAGDHLSGNGSGPSLDKLRLQINELKGNFDYLLIDAPPIGLYSDAAVLGHLADGVILILEAHVTRRAAARRAKEMLEAANVRLLGTVLNNRTFPIPETIYRRL